MLQGIKKTKFSYLQQFLSEIIKAFKSNVFKTSFTATIAYTLFLTFSKAFNSAFFDFSVVDRKVCPYRLSISIYNDSVFRFLIAFLIAYIVTLDYDEKTISFIAIHQNRVINHIYKAINVITILILFMISVPIVATLFLSLLKNKIYFSIPFGEYLKFLFWIFLSLITFSSAVYLISTLLKNFFYSFVLVFSLFFLPYFIVVPTSSKFWTFVTFGFTYVLNLKAFGFQFNYKFPEFIQKILDEYDFSLLVSVSLVVVLASGFIIYYWSRYSEITE